MGFYCLLPLLLLVSLPESVPDQVELEKDVTAYWNALMRRDKNAALEWVLSESRNNFILRREPLFRSWRLVEIKPASENEAKVTVSLEQMVEGAPGFYHTKVGENWVFDGQVWKVRVKRITAEEFKKVYQGSGQKSPPQLPPILQVLPQLLKIHFLTPSQRGVMVVRNGLEVPARVVRVEYDQEKFELLEKPAVVQAGGQGKIIIKHIGEEVEKELKSQVTLVLEQGAQEQVFSIPVLYNHLSPGARGLLGLTEEKAQKLRRGDKVAPVIQIPQTRSGEKPRVEK